MKTNREIKEYLILKYNCRRADTRRLKDPLGNEYDAWHVYASFQHDKPPRWFFAGYAQAISKEIEKKENSR